MIKLHLTMIPFLLLEIHVVILIILDIPFLFVTLVVMIIIMIIAMTMPHFIIIIMLIFLLLEHFLVFFGCILTAFVNGTIASVYLHIVFLCPPWIPFVPTVILLIIIELYIWFIVSLVCIFIFRVFWYIVTII